VGGGDAGVEEVFGAEEQRWADRYGLLFLLIVVSLILSAANTTWLKVVAIVLQGGVVLFAFLAARAGRHAWRLAIVLVPVGVIVGIAGRIGGGSQPSELVAAIVSVVLPTAAIVALARRIMKEPFVSGRSVLGLLSVYLLIGMTFAATYVTIAVASEEPFFAQAEHAEPVDFTYFSFVTLATVGYGDFTAANPMPRMLAAIEGLTGQLYLVTVVAVAVSRVRTRREPPPGG
jgi:voltage-gated potassium channel